MGGAPMWRGIPVCSCLLPLLNDLASGTPTLPRIIPTQGSWSTSVSASAQTHAGGGVLDISLRGWSSAQVLSLLVECRRRGLVAWSRTALQGFAPHVHAVMDGCPHLSGRDRPVVGTAAWQVAEYRAGRNGLAGRGRDDGPREYVGSTWWTYSTPTRPEVDMPLTTADVNAIWDEDIDGVTARDRAYFAHRRAQAALEETLKARAELATITAKLDALAVAVAAIKTGTVTGEVTVTGGTLTVGA